MAKWSEVKLDEESEKSAKVVSHVQIEETQIYG